ncbi:biotin--[acetyl-CoA-carboxylase] ligase [Thermocrinis minervae]|uniref:biotin--[biotin carboxyl-carrier protein] ligase n=1 Tax=Thermocrinis minervae TaxID=381751 RepID=A0A1M6TL73_9AQUI|nr:biotin--[acetyl-CoA-carboxylase] ligase [Thermocrinis minervae]SHK57653.1 BirA family transcriptional regulator, biotin operon repressor / biotin-[acetyl-CoA-carboxylase] ligase [Thermocrinis minervae]
MGFDYLVWLEEVDSTQDVLKSFEFPFGTVVVAKRQRKGRGRQGREWHSQEGGLYFSFLLNSEEFKEVPPLPLVIGLAVCNYLIELGFYPSIKWVNDVYLKGKKVCGVLVEKQKEKLICGVGFNVNQETLPPEAISLYMVDGVKRDLRKTLSSLLDHIDKSLEEFKSSGFSPFKDRIEERLMFLGQEVILMTEPPTVGILKGLSEDGSLILQTSKGDVKVISGDITLRPYV